MKNFVKLWLAYSKKSKYFWNLSYYANVKKTKNNSEKKPRKTFSNVFFIPNKRKQSMQSDGSISDRIDFVALSAQISSIRPMTCEIIEQNGWEQKKCSQSIAFSDTYNCTTNKQKTMKNCWRNEIYSKQKRKATTKMKQIKQNREQTNFLGNRKHCTQACFAKSLLSRIRTHSNNNKIW